MILDVSNFFLFTGKDIKRVLAFCPQLSQYPERICITYPHLRNSVSSYPSQGLPQGNPYFSQPIYSYSSKYSISPIHIFQISSRCTPSSHPFTCPSHSDTNDTAYLYFPCHISHSFPVFFASKIPIFSGTFPSYPIPLNPISFPHIAHSSPSLSLRQ